MFVEFQLRISGLLTSTTGRICLSMLYKVLLFAFRPCWQNLLNSRSFMAVGEIQHKLCFNESNFFCCFVAVTPDNFLMTAYQSGPQILEKVLKRSKRPEVQNIVGSDGITYPSVISQPFPAFRTWNSTALDMEMCTVYLSNFGYGMQTEPIVFSTLPTEYFSTSDRWSSEITWPSQVLLELCRSGSTSKQRTN